MRPTLICCLLLLAACSKPAPVTLHPLDAIPGQLSAWGVLLADGEYLRLNENVHPYELNTPLFSDYAIKLRTVWLPEGESAGYSASDEFDFPVGTIISKTFYYEKADGWTVNDARVVRAEREAMVFAGRIDLDRHVLVETRLLVRDADGWSAYPYVWNRAQTEAWLEIAGDARVMTLVDAERSQDFFYMVPDQNQCSGCHAPDHTGGEIRPIGTKAIHLNRDNQIEHWRDAGVLSNVDEEIPTGARWLKPGGATLNERARIYLDINCAHCHNSAGAADTSGLHLDIEAPVDRNFGICKSPTAVGQGSGDRLYDIHPGEPDESILMYRMEHTDPAIAMPELGRSTVHNEGVALIRKWIASLEGDC